MEYQKTYLDPVEMITLTEETKKEIDDDPIYYKQMIEREGLLVDSKVM